MLLRNLRWVMALVGLVLLAGCTEDNPVSNGLLTSEEVVVVVTTDYISGGVTALQNDGNTVSLDLLSIWPDNWVAAHGEFVYILERFGADNIIKLPANNIGPSAVVYQYSVGNGSNPQEMVFVSDRKAYVSRLNKPALWIVDPGAASEAAFKLGEVDLSAYADGDGLPEASPMAVVDGKLYVGCQRLDQNGGWTPLDARLVVIDTATDQIIKAIVLERGNPHAMAAHAGKLYVTCEGDALDPTDGGIEVVDIATDSYEGVLVSESDLGGNVGGLAIRSDAKAYVVAGGYDESWVARYAVYPFDPLSGQVGSPLAGATAAAEVALGGNGVLYVADRSADQPGIYTYDASDNLISGPISTGLPPNALVVAGGH